MKVTILTVLTFKLRASIISISVMLATHALSTIMPMHVPPSVFLEVECLNELTDRGSSSRGVNECSEFSCDVLIDEGQLIFNTLNVC